MGERRAAPGEAVGRFLLAVHNFAFCLYELAQAYSFKSLLEVW